MHNWIHFLALQLSVCSFSFFQAEEFAQESGKKSSKKKSASNNNEG